nr:MAG TPA: hypothetical protein [Caudoviricetes sp.]
MQCSRFVAQWESPWITEGVLGSTPSKPTNLPK